MNISSFDVAYHLESLVNGSSQAMNVDGSSTPVTFKWEPGAGEIWFLHRIFFFMLDTGTMAHNVFGSLGSALTNGIDIKLHKGGEDHLLKNLKDNVDLLMCFNQDIRTGGSATAFLNDEDYFMGAIEFNTPIKMVYDSSDNDSVKIVVNDDLTNLTRMRSEILLREDL